MQQGPFQGSDSAEPWYCSLCDLDDTVQSAQAFIASESDDAL